MVFNSSVFQLDSGKKQLLLSISTPGAIQTNFVSPSYHRVPNPGHRLSVLWGCIKSEVWYQSKASVHNKLFKERELRMGTVSRHVGLVGRPCSGIWQCTSGLGLCGNRADSMSLSVVLLLKHAELNCLRCVRPAGSMWQPNLYLGRSFLARPWQNNCSSICIWFMKGRGSYCLPCYPESREEEEFDSGLVIEGPDKKSYISQLYWLQGSFFEFTPMKQKADSALHSSLCSYFGSLRQRQWINDANYFIHSFA